MNQIILYKFICNLFRNKEKFSLLDYKIYNHCAKRLIKKGYDISTKKCEDFEASEIRKLYSKYKKVVQNLNEKIKNNQKIKVSFLVIFDSVFPAEPLYQKMLEDEFFEPQIIVIPDTSRGEDNMYIQMEKTYKTLNAKYKNVQKSWDEKHQKFIDFSKEMDIVCSANPYDGMTHKLYRIGKLSKKDILPIYFNYGYPAVLWARRVAALDSLSKMWKVFSESPATMEEYSNSMKTHGENLVLAGYMKMDNLAKQPIRKRERKTIIIAPHHTIEAKFRNSIGLSNFLEYAELFQELPKKYPQIDFIFRPHPLLRVTLAQNHIWGQEKTDKYFKDLEKNPNLTYQACGDYFETFANSDGIIHDCSSFLAEYMFTGKPVCYMLKTKDSIDKFFMNNGKQILENCYKAFSKEEIYDYIDNVIIKGNDPMATKREEFAKKELMVNYPNVSTFVLDYIKKELGVNS